MNKTILRLSVCILLTTIIYCEKSQWPKGDFYDFSARFKPGIVEYRSFQETTFKKEYNDRATLVELFEGIIKTHEELVKTGRRPSVFSKGLFLEFNPNLNYDEFQQAYKAVGYLASSRIVALRIGNIGINTSFNCFFGRSDIWKDRPMVVLTKNGISLSSNVFQEKQYKFEDSLSFGSDIDSILNGLSKNRSEVDPYFRILGDDNLIRVTADNEVTIQQISLALRQISNRHSYIYKFYVLSDTSPEIKKINLPDTCSDLSRSVFLHDIELIQNKAGFNIDEFNGLKREAIALNFKYQRNINKIGEFEGKIIVRMSILSCGVVKEVKILDGDDGYKRMINIITQVFENARFNPVCDKNGQTDIQFTLKFGTP